MFNTFGNLLRITTFGESHGKAIGAVIDGLPSGIPVEAAYIQAELNRRRPGQSEITSPRDEKDRVEILSGVYEGLSTGTPIALIIRNIDVRSEDYLEIKNMYRPGHADYTYDAKYGIRDWRGSGRASGRETAARVAAGAIAKKFLETRGIRIYGYTLEIGAVRAEIIKLGEIEKNPVRCPDPGAAEKMVNLIKKLRDEGDSIGGIIEARVIGCPAGLGEPVFDKLEARIAQAIMSIGGIRGFEVGAGFGCSRMKGSEFNDIPVYKDGRIGFATNHAGGIVGGISTGEDILIRVAVRPPASISKPQKIVNKSGKSTVIEIKGRHDPCIVPRVVPVVEAMLSLVIADFVLLQRRFQDLDKKS